MFCVRVVQKNVQLQLNTTPLNRPTDRSRTGLLDTLMNIVCWLPNLTSIIIIIIIISERNATQRETHQKSHIPQALNGQNQNIHFNLLLSSIQFLMVNFEQGWEGYTRTHVVPAIEHHNTQSETVIIIILPKLSSFKRT